MLSVMSGNGSMGCFSFNRTIWALKHRCHQTKRAITLSNDIRLNITIIVFACPDKSTFRFDGVSNHIVNQSMFVPGAKGIELTLVVSLENFFENIFESTIVFLHNSVLGRHVHWVFPFNGLLETIMSKTSDGFVSIVHAHSDTWILEFKNGE